MKKTAALLFSLALITGIAACGSPPGASLPAPVAPETVSSGAAEPEATPTPEPEPSAVTLTLAGDLVMHTPLNDEALQPDGSYDYTPLFEYV